MIGWKILCNLDAEEVVCEVVGQAVADDGGFAIPVYHNGNIRMAWYIHDEKIKVIERK